MFYSGDVDAAVPIVGSQRWVDELRVTLNMFPIQLWTPWYTAGYNCWEP